MRAMPGLGSSARPTPTRPPRPGGSPWTRRADGADPHPAERSRCWPRRPTAPPTGVARGAYVLARRDRAGRPTSCSSGRAARSTSAWRPPSRWPSSGVAGPGGVVPVAGSCSRPQDEALPGRGPPRRRAPAGRRGGHLVRLGALRRRQSSASTISGPRRPARSSMDEFGFTPDNVAERASALLDESRSPPTMTGDPGRRVRAAGRKDAHDQAQRSLSTSRVRAPGSTTCGATGSEAARLADLVTDGHPRGDLESRPSSPRRSRARTPTTSSSARSSDRSRSRTPTGTSSSTTSTTPSASCARLRLVAAAPTDSSRSRSPLAGQRHRRDHRRGPGPAPADRPAQPAWSRSRPPPKGVPAIQPDDRRGPEHQRHA